MSATTIAPNDKNIAAPMGRILYHVTDFKIGKYARVTMDDKCEGFYVEVFSWTGSNWLPDRHVHRCTEESAISYANSAF